ncbi:hypothetical protein NOX90_05735 [Wolbachia endosymbiont of Anurida maritima]
MELNMVEGGAVDTGNSEYLTQGVLEIIQESEDLEHVFKLKNELICEA